MQQKMSWKEYDLSNKSIADWLPWLGLSHEFQSTRPRGARLCLFTRA